MYNLLTAYDQMQTKSEIFTQVNNQKKLLKFLNSPFHG